MRGSIYWVLLLWDCFAVTKPLSQIQRSTLWPLQDANQTPSFGGFGLKLTYVLVELGDKGFLSLPVSILVCAKDSPSSFNQCSPPGADLAWVDLEPASYLCCGLLTFECLKGYLSLKGGAVLLATLLHLLLLRAYFVILGAGTDLSYLSEILGPSHTGWTLGNKEYMELRSLRDSDWPYGRISWHFEYVPDDHDDGEKEFLGHRGRFNGEDIIDIICQQPDTARFIARRMYHFFVADEPPVPQWPYTPPADPAAIEELSRAYFDSNYNISSMLRVLFNSQFFRSEGSWYSKVKSPMDLVVGVLRLTGEFERPRREILDRMLQAIYMGQYLNNPPSVEGWHQGTAWIDTGTLVERVNFASQEVGNPKRPGVQAMIERIASQGERITSPEDLVDACLDQVGAISVSGETRAVLTDFASKGGELGEGAMGLGEGGRKKIGDMLQMVAAAPEFQRV